jgi:Tol biopolymer transport system component
LAFDRRHNGWYNRRSRLEQAAAGSSKENSVNPFVIYVIAAILFVLGLAAIGGATFGKQRNRRIVLAVLGVALWAATLVIYSRAATLAPTTPEPAPQAEATSLPPTSTAVLQATSVLTATAAAAPFPPVGGRVVFHSDRDGEIDIYVMDADGSNVQRLTDAPGRDFEPAWSPDGSTIAFSTDRDDPDNAQLYLMDADGSNQRRLPSSLVDDQVGARWSPDGQWILFHSNPLVDGLPQFDVFKIRPDGSDLTNLTNTTGNNFMADWSPDGERIVFVSQRNGNRDLYLMNADGSNQTRLTDGGWENSLPRWSPDGRQIAFESNRMGTTYGVYLIDAPDEQNAGASLEDTVRVLTFPGFNHSTPAWAGNEWLYISADRDSTNLINWEIYLLKADGSEIYRVTENDGIMDRFPSWTPIDP